MRPSTVATRVPAEKLEFQTTLKPGRANLAEIQFAVLANMCLTRRIVEEGTL